MSKANEAIYNAESKSVKSKFMDCHDSTFSESRNDRNTDSKSIESKLTDYAEFYKVS